MQFRSQITGFDPRLIQVREDKKYMNENSIYNGDYIMDAKTMNEVKDVIEKYYQLEDQKSRPSREGMIKALSDAQQVASSEILIVERKQGDIYPAPWTAFQDHDLYRKLDQYQQGLLTHCVNKYGEEFVKKAIKEITGNNR